MTEITFCAQEEIFGTLAEPVPAKRTIEDWYRKLPVIIDLNQSFDGTVKGCPAFLDAMTLGYMFGMPADVTISVTDNQTVFDAKWRFPGPILEHYHRDQVKGHPKESRPVIKVLTHWSIRTQPGWSCLVLPPINHAELPLEAFAAVIDTDVLSACLILPCFLNLPDGMHFIPKGTPVAQLVPFKREPVEVTIRAETEDETKARAKQERFILSQTGAYRKHLQTKEA